jgi:hypothetical protein
LNSLTHKVRTLKKYGLHMHPMDYNIATFTRRKNTYSWLLFATKSQVTFATKIPLVTLDKSHVTRVSDERKIQQIQVHPLTPLYMYCYIRLRCDYFGHTWGQNDVLPCVPIFNYLKYKYNCYFEIIEGVLFKCLDDLIQNINIRLVGTYLST